MEDLVFDSMHTLLFRIVKHHLEYYIDNGYLSSPVVERRLQAMPWTAGCIPYHCAKCTCYYNISDLS